MAQTVKNPPAMQGTRVQPLGWEDPLEKGMAAHSSILAWRIPWAEEPGSYGLKGSKELDVTERLSTAQYKVIERLKWRLRSYKRRFVNLNESL